MFADVSLCLSHSLTPKDFEALQKKELFIVEGKSAAAAVTRAIDSQTQSVHAMQGKLINVDKVSSKVVAANLECQQLMSCLGCGVDPQCQPEKLAYSTLLILMDPDVDGAHSSALLMSFFARYCRPIVAAGLLSIIKAPKYRVGGEAGEARYAWSEQELETLLDGKCKTDSLSMTRFKGVAQFSIEECRHYLSDPNTRRQILLTDAVD